MIKRNILFLLFLFAGTACWGMEQSNIDQLSNQPIYITDSGIRMFLLNHGFDISQAWRDAFAHKNAISSSRHNTSLANIKATIEEIFKSAAKTLKNITMSLTSFDDSTLALLGMTLPEDEEEQHETINQNIRLFEEILQDEELEREEYFIESDQDNLNASEIVRAIGKIVVEYYSQATILKRLENTEKENLKTILHVPQIYIKITIGDKYIRLSSIPTASQATYMYVPIHEHDTAIPLSPLTTKEKMLVALKTLGAIIGISALATGMLYVLSGFYPWVNQKNSFNNALENEDEQINECIDPTDINGFAVYGKTSTGEMVQCDMRTHQCSYVTLADTNCNPQYVPLTSPNDETQPVLWNWHLNENCKTPNFKICPNSLTPTMKEDLFKEVAKQISSYKDIFEDNELINAEGIRLREMLKSLINDNPYEFTNQQIVDLKLLAKLPFEKQEHHGEESKEDIPEDEYSREEQELLGEESKEDISEDTCSKEEMFGNTCPLEEQRQEESKEELSENSYSLEEQKPLGQESKEVVSEDTCPLEEQRQEVTICYKTEQPSHEIVQRNNSVNWRDVKFDSTSEKIKTYQSKRTAEDGQLVNWKIFNPYGPEDLCPLNDGSSYPQDTCPLNTGSSASNLKSWLST